MLVDDARLNDLTGTILAGAIEVHRILGPGLLESTYLRRSCLLTCDLLGNRPGCRSTSMFHD